MLTATPDAIVLLANRARMMPGDGRGYRRVQSRMLLWCNGGEGDVQANGDAYALTAGDFLLLPWDHAIAYRPARRWELAGIHVVPSLQPGSPAPYGVLHEPGGSPRELATAYRHDVQLPRLERVVHGRLEHVPALRALADYTLARCSPTAFREATARQLGQLQLAEWQATAEQVQAHGQDLPASLRRLLSYLEDHLTAPLALADLARIAHCSTATLNRRFREHLQTSPMAWLQQRRLEHAADLLATTALPVAEIGRLSGIDDPYYFSRLFRQQMGVCCTDYRNRHALLTS